MFGMWNSSPIWRSSRSVPARPWIVQGLWRGAMQAIASNPICCAASRCGWTSATQTASPVLPHGRGLCPAVEGLAANLTPQCGQRLFLSAPAQLLATASSFIHQPPEKLARALDHCIETGKRTGRENVRCAPYPPADLLAAEQDIADRLNLLAKTRQNTARSR